MNPEHLRSFDLETHLTQPGLPCPPMVCASVATSAQGSERLLDKRDGLATLETYLSDPSITVINQTLDFDLGVAAVERPELIPLIFEAIEQGRAISIDVIEKLHRNAIGTLDDRSHGNALSELEKRYLGIDRSAEKEDGWRQRYALFEDLPLAEWPDEAIQYARQDARGAMDVGMRQLGFAGARVHEWEEVEIEGAKPTDFMQTELVCQLCGYRGSGATGECPQGQIPKAKNLECLTQEMQAAWFLRLASIWGMRTDAEMVEHVTGEIVRRHEESRRRFFDEGIVRVRPCNKKEGEYERGDAIDTAWLNERTEVLCSIDPAPEWLPRRLADLQQCRKALAKGRPVRFAEDRSVLRALVLAAYQGAPPETAGGDTRGPETSISRDTLEESGDPLLESYAEVGANEKLFSTYTDVLRQGATRPICPSFDSTKATQRTSYFHPNLQQLPRKGAVRECFVPRGYVEVEE